MDPDASLRRAGGFGLRPQSARLDMTPAERRK
jgi:hypothetical protein